MFDGTCSIEGCKRPIYVKSRALCSRCYQRSYACGLPPLPPDVSPWHRLSNVDPDALVADCTVCGPRVTVRVKSDCNSKRGYWFKCSAQIAEQGKRDAARKRERRAQSGAENRNLREPFARGESPEAQRRRWRLRTKYDLTPEQYEQMYADQRGRCLICRDSHPRLYVDHDHSTGAVRGLLCRYCNFALGWLRDSAPLAERAAEYLRLYQPTSPSTPILIA